MNAMNTLNKFISLVLISALCAAGLFLILKPSPSQLTESEEISDEISTLAPLESAYGVDFFATSICFDRIKANQNLSEILNDFGLSMADIDRLAKASKDIFDVRKIRTGQPYCIIKDPDATRARYFIYEADAINYVVFDLSDSLNIYFGKKQVEIRRREISGIIESSPYMTMVNNGFPPELAIRLSEIYAWNIDFYRIQHGDRFRVIYDEKYVDGNYVGLGAVHAAQFNHFSHDYYAIWFEQDSVGDFFEENATSLRKAFLKAPLKYSRISSGFSNRRFHPVLKKFKAHLGVDYAAPTGTPIHSVGDGVIDEATYKSNNGRYVKVRHNGTYSTQYLHMSRIADGIKPGVRVVQGQVIGYVGSTGLATGPHVCFRFWQNGQQVNPLKVDIPPAEPIRAECMEAFNWVKTATLAELHAIPFNHEAESSHLDSQIQ